VKPHLRGDCLAAAASYLIGNQDTTDDTPGPFWQVLVSAAVDRVVEAFVAAALYGLSWWLG
jgi:hypothetical protein